MLSMKKDIWNIFFHVISSCQKPNPYMFHTKEREQVEKLVNAFSINKHMLDILVLIIFYSLVALWNQGTIQSLTPKIPSVYMARNNPFISLCSNNYLNNSIYRLKRLMLLFSWFCIDIINTLPIILSKNNLNL